MTAELVRLHVSPLSPETYRIVIPPSLHTAVSAVSYHQVPTFPERNYGYLELPQADADTLQRRLHGAIVKGVKLRVEAARPKIEYISPTDAGSKLSNRLIGAGKHQSVSLSLSAGAIDSAKPGDSTIVLRGVHLPSDRRVRRGWTQPLVMKRDRRSARGAATATGAEGGTGKKSRMRSAKKSEFTDKEECLFKTTKPKAKKKDSLDHSRDAGKKRKRGDDALVVHEFEKTSKFPSFLRSATGGSAKKPTAEYDPDKGWVDADGEVVEQPRRSKRLSQEMPREVAVAVAATEGKDKVKTASVTKAAKKLSLQGQEAAGDTSSSGDSESTDEEVPTRANRLSLQSAPEVNAVASASDDTDNEEEERPKKSVELATPRKEFPETPRLAVSDVDEGKDRDKGKDTEVHPLEAIFKKPKGRSKKPPGLSLKIPFSFFGGQDDDDDSDGDNEGEAADKPGNLPQMPQTPFTQADLRFRRQRSAAPTPDTAAPTKLLFGPVLDRPPPQQQSPPRQQPTPGEEDDNSVHDKYDNYDGNDDGDDNDDDDDDPMSEPSEATSTAPTAATAASKTRSKRSEFADKWFWENRGDNNRAWKKRRREAAKQQRQAANKKGGSRRT